MLERTGFCGARHRCIGCTWSRVSVDRRPRLSQTVLLPMLISISWLVTRFTLTQASDMLFTGKGRGPSQTEMSHIVAPRCIGCTWSRVSVDRRPRLSQTVLLPMVISISWLVANFTLTQASDMLLTGKGRRRSQTGLSHSVVPRYVGRLPVTC